MQLLLYSNHAVEIVVLRSVPAGVITLLGSLLISSTVTNAPLSLALWSVTVLRSLLIASHAPLTFALATLAGYCCAFPAGALHRSTLLVSAASLRHG